MCKTNISPRTAPNHQDYLRSARDVLEHVLRTIRAVKKKVKHFPQEILYPLLRHSRHRLYQPQLSPRTHPMREEKLRRKTFAVGNSNNPKTEREHYNISVWLNSIVTPALIYQHSCWPYLLNCPNTSLNPKSQTCHLSSYGYKLYLFPILLLSRDVYT